MQIRQVFRLMKKIFNHGNGGCGGFAPDFPLIRTTSEPYCVHSIVAEAALTLLCACILPHGPRKVKTPVRPFFAKIDSAVSAAAPGDILALGGQSAAQMPLGLVEIQHPPGSPV